MKKFLICLLCALTLSITPCISFANSISATRSDANMVIDENQHHIYAYNINGNNYFKLRDLAYVLSGTAKQFDVEWDDGSNSILLTAGKKYKMVGGELEGYYPKEVVASPSNFTVYLDSKKISLKSYNIRNNNYFKLRDLGKALDFSIEWVEKEQRIYIETAYGYIEETNSYEIVHKVNVPDTNSAYISNWGNVSPVQQFKYMDEGMAYAYKADNKLNIVTPTKNLNFEMKYPLLGDVISDDAGNFYVVYGQENKSNTTNTETVFVSKYSSGGKHIKTVGFVGESAMGQNGNTKKPFAHGNCSSAIHNGVLMVNYSRTMYNGHQSNNVVGVNINTMTKVKFNSVWDIPYTSHSFNQKVIWSNKSNGFVYADHGDAYGRGFIVTTKNGSKNIFHFYLEANANYNMYIVNKTFAQLGGLAETSKGVVLVGASVKSISESAKSEKQNLFVQIFNPNSTQISSSMFVGGKKRIGATSFDINDNSNSPLESVTDYGVQWITNHTDRDVVSPHAVVANDHIVILWNENKKGETEPFYTVLSSSGSVVKAPASLGKGRMLNSNEEPVYHNGTLYWASTSNGVIRVDSVKLDF